MVILLILHHVPVKVEVIAPAWEDVNALWLKQKRPLPHLVPVKVEETALVWEDANVRPSLDKIRRMKPLNRI